VNRLEGVIGIAADTVEAGITYPNTNIVVNGESVIEAIGRLDASAGGNPVLASTTAIATGTITVTAGSTAIIGSGTSFTSGDVGKVIVTNGGQARKIASYTNSTSVTADVSFASSETTINFFLAQRVNSTKQFLQIPVLPANDPTYKDEIARKDYVDRSTVKAISSKSAGYTAVASDKGTAFLCTNTFTFALTAAATLGSLWYCYIHNNGTGIITIDPDSSETIDLASTLLLYPNESAFIVCDGSNFQTLSRSKFINTFESSEISITAAGTFSADPSSGLKGLTPKWISLWLICKSAEHGYSVGDEVPASDNFDSNMGAQIYTKSPTNIAGIFGSSVNTFRILHKTTGASSVPTNASWRLIIRAGA